MKKLCVLMGLALVICGWIGLAMLNNNEVVSDEDIAMSYIINEYGEDDYELVMYEEEDDEYIKFAVFKDGKPFRTCSILRDYYLVHADS